MGGEESVSRPDGQNSLNQKKLQGSLPKDISNSLKNPVLIGEDFSKSKEEQNMFESGTFGAKYITNKGSFINQNAGSLIQNASTNNSNIVTKSIKSLSSSSSEKEIETYDVKACKPITIQGGFQSGSSTNVHTPTRASNTTISNSTSALPDRRERRHSVLSSMISSTVFSRPNEGSSMTNSTELTTHLTRSDGIKNDEDSTITTDIDVENPHPIVVQTVQKHLVKDGSKEEDADKNKKDVISPAGADFSSLKLQGGDITRGIYNWANEHNGNENSPGVNDGKNSVRSIGSTLKRSNSHSGRIPNRRLSDNNDGDTEDNTIDEIMTPSNIQMPGGFRRSFIAQRHMERNLDEIRSQTNRISTRKHQKQDRKSKAPNFLTRNFIEFLTLYGHFAGEDLDDEDEGDDFGRNKTRRKSFRRSLRGGPSILDNELNAEEEEYESTTQTEDSESEYDEDMVIEDEPLHPSSSPFDNSLSLGLSDRRGRMSNIGLSDSPGAVQPNIHYSTLAGSARMRQKSSKKLRNKPNKKANSKSTYSNYLKQEINDSKNRKVSNKKALLLLLKAFIGTGIVFLPKAFSNGGLLFCNVLIIFFSILSYYCFVILIKTTSNAQVTSYGDVGLKIYGRYMKAFVLVSLVLSQLGFASSYVVFVAENLHDLLNAILSTDYGIGTFIFIQLAIFLPLSLTRNIGKLSFTALIADFFILCGLIYIYTCSSVHLISNGPSPKVSLFKSDTWSLFIGTVVFAYEGIGLLIPIQESMQHPEKFNSLLVLVMVIVSIIFVTLSTICYLSYGDDVQTVILMNFPKNTLGLVIQMLYSIAILLSTPLQLFPAIKIVENYLFSIERKPWQEKVRRESESIHNHSLLLSDDTPFLSNITSNGNNNNLEHTYSAISRDDISIITAEGTISGKADPSIKWMKNILRVFIVLLMCLIGFYGSNDLDRFVSLIGSFTCIPLIYIYPPLLYLKSFGGIGLKWGQSIESNPSSVSIRSRSPPLNATIHDHIGSITSDDYNNYDGTRNEDNSRLNKLEICINVMILILGVSLMAYTSFQTISSWIGQSF